MADTPICTNYSHLPEPGRNPKTHRLPVANTTCRWQTPLMDTKGHRPCALLIERSRKGRAIRGQIGVAAVGLRVAGTWITGYEGTLGGDGCSAPWYVVSIEPTTHMSKLAHCPSQRVCFVVCKLSANRVKREAVAVALRTTRPVRQRCKRSTQDVKSPQDVRTGDPCSPKCTLPRAAGGGAQSCCSDLPRPCPRPPTSRMPSPSSKGTAGAG